MKPNIYFRQPCDLEPKKWQRFFFSILLRFGAIEQTETDVDFESGPADEGKTPLGRKKGLAGSVPDRRLRIIIIIVRTRRKRKYFARRFRTKI